LPSSFHGFFEDAEQGDGFSVDGLTTLFAELMKTLAEAVILGQHVPYSHGNRRL